jgi:hypothetical protein
MAVFRRSDVRNRADDRCEYCQLPQTCSVLPHEIDHIRARKHHGATTMQNTCWACAYCNAAKGSNAAGFDPESGNLVDCLIRAWIHGLSTSHGMALDFAASLHGRATLDVLQINDPKRVQHRRLLRAAGVRFGV